MITYATYSKFNVKLLLSYESIICRNISLFYYYGLPCLSIISKLISIYVLTQNYVYLYYIYYSLHSFLLVLLCSIYINL